MPDKKTPAFADTYFVAFVISGIFSLAIAAVVYAPNKEDPVDAARSILQKLCWAPTKVLKDNDYNSTISIKSIHNQTLKTETDGNTTSQTTVDEIISSEAPKISSINLPDNRPANPGTGKVDYHQSYWPMATVAFTAPNFLTKGIHQETWDISGEPRIGLWEPNSPTYQTNYRGQVVTLKCE